MKGCLATENENKNKPDNNDDDRISLGGDKGEKFSVFEINARLKKEQLEEESRRTERLAEKERAEREAYSKQLAKDRIELMKIKAGVTEEAPQEEKAERHYTVPEKISNFFYHNKMYIIFTAIIGALAAFLIYDFVTNVQPDVAVMVLAKDNEFYFISEKMEKALEPYCEDFNGDGEVYVRVSYLPAVVDNSNPEELYYAQGDQTKLVAEFQSDTSIIVIADEYTCDVVNISNGVLADMREVYPDDENATKLGYMLKDTGFKEDIGYEELSDELFIGFRVPLSGPGINEEDFEQNYNNALKMWDNYLNDNVVNEVLTE